MGRSPEDYESLHRPPSPFLRGYRVFCWRAQLVFSVLWIAVGTFIIVLDTWDWLNTDIKIQNWSWPIAIIGLVVVWGVGAFMFWLASAMLKHLSDRK